MYNRMRNTFGRWMALVLFKKPKKTMTLEELEKKILKSNKRNKSVNPKNIFGYSMDRPAGISSSGGVRGSSATRRRR